MTPNTNTPEQSAIPEEFQKYVTDKACDRFNEADYYNLRLAYIDGATDTYRHLRGQPAPFPDFPHPFEPDVSDTKEDHFYRKHCAWYWKQLRECQEELSALRSQPIPSLGLKKGDKVVLDKDFNNASVVILAKTAKHYSTVCDQAGDTWEVMTDRLSAIASQEESLLPVQPEPDKISLIQLDTILREFYTKNAEANGSGYGRRLIARYAAQHCRQPSIEPDAPINE